MKVYESAIPGSSEGLIFCIVCHLIGLECFLCFFDKGMFVFRPFPFWGQFSPESISTKGYSVFYKPWRGSTPSKASRPAQHGIWNFYHYNYLHFCCIHSFQYWFPLTPKKNIRNLAFKLILLHSKAYLLSQSLPILYIIK